MNYKENYQQEQKEAEKNRLIHAFNQITIFVVTSNYTQITYQIAYDVVVKLTKQNQQQVIMGMIKEKMAQLVRERFEGIVKNQKTIWKLNDIFKQMAQKNQKFSQICLYLNENYFQKVKNSSLKLKLYEHTFTLLCHSQKILQLIAQGLFNSRNNLRPQFKELLKLIKQLDQNDQFFEHHLLKPYEGKIRKYYDQEGFRQWSQLSHNEYFNWCKQQLTAQRTFIEGLFVQKRKYAGLQIIINAIYQCIVLNFKEKIYQIDDKTLFQNLTISILELFNFSKNKGVQVHVQWFLKGIQKRLNSIPLNDNALFINIFCQLYQKVNQYLKDNLGRFQITYRSVFTFQEWINNQRYSIPQRLNLFINQKLMGKNQQPFQKFSSNAALILKLLKEKTLFQKMYRQTLLERLGQLYLTYNLQQELKLIGTMQKQCGEDWTKKISSICSLFQKNRQKAIQIMQQNKENKGKGCILPVIVEQNDWPFEEKQSKISLHPQLQELIPSYQSSYLQNNKNHKLIWSPKIGTVLMNIKFKKTKRDVLVSIEAANILLYLQKGVCNLTYYLCQTGYKLDDVQSAVHTLTKSGLVISTPKGSDVTLELAHDFEAGNLLDLAMINTLNNVEVKAMQQLKAQRKLMVEAIVVKIIKNQKKCQRTDLVKKTAPLLAKRGFNFNADFVQKSIDRLLDKQFIRDIEDGYISYIA